MLDKIYRNSLMFVQIVLAWSLITCCLVGAWTIYQHGASLLNTKISTEPKTIIISGGMK